MAKKSRRERRLELATKKQRRSRIILGVGLSILLAAVILLVLLLPSANDNGNNNEARLLADVLPADRNNYYTEPPPMTIDTDRNYSAVIRTEKGDITLRLFPNESPITVNNFVFLARQGYFDGLTFHRVVPAFMAQSGDPTGTGAGGPGYEFQDETNNGLTFDRPGILAMANRGPNTNGSQFFITYVPTPHLDGVHTIFGELVSGQDALNALTPVVPDGVNPSGGDVIDRVDIIVE